MSFFISSGSKFTQRRIAVLRREGKGPPLVWLGGFRSDMRATKAEALDRACAETGRAFLRFDYSGHGESEGLFEEGSISWWLDDTLAVIDQCISEPPVLIGSSMGGWIALLAALHLRKVNPQKAPSALVLIAPAVDFTQELMWKSFSASLQQQIETEGKIALPSAYSDEPTIITRHFIEDGKKHRLLEGILDPGCPVHILQGRLDPDVPWTHALRLMEHMPSTPVKLNLIPDGDHRLSRPDDIDLIIKAAFSCSGNQ